jgi:phage baseplate assembly protein W
MVTKAFSIEDGNLQSRAIVTTRNKLYRDLDLTFAKRPSGDVYKKQDAAAVKQAVKNLLLTNFGEKPFNPFYGGNLQGLLFELADDTTAEDIDINIRQAIAKYEPRAEVVEVSVTLYPDNYSASIRVTFRVVNTSEIVVLDTAIVRLR